MSARRDRQWPVRAVLVVLLAGWGLPAPGAGSDGQAADAVPSDARIERLRAAIAREREALEREREKRRSMAEELGRVRDELDRTRERLEELERAADPGARDGD
ncbi:MAG: hypothetical protein V5A42_01535 [Halofilum sp. (in: g-proteobacteria)]